MKGNEHMKKTKTVAKYLSLVVFIAVVLIVAFVFYCLDRGRSSREFQRYITNKGCIWKAEEIDCTLYSMDTGFYEDIKEKYDIDEAYEDPEILLGVMTLNGKKIPVMFRKGGPGDIGDLAEAYYNSEQKYFEPYEDMMVEFDYTINFWKNKLSIKIDDERILMKDNEFAKYLKNKNINEITFVKDNEKSEDTYEWTIKGETDTTLNDRYEKAFGVNVLYAKYDKNKKRMEIVIENNKDYDIEDIYLCIALKGKTAYDLSNRWKYEEILPYYEGYEVDYYYEEKIDARSEKKIIISGVDDNQISDIKAMVNFYKCNGEIFQSPAWPSFHKIVSEEYLRSLTK